MILYTAKVLQKSGRVYVSLFRKWHSLTHSARVLKPPKQRFLNLLLGTRQYVTKTSTPKNTVRAEQLTIRKRNVSEVKRLFILAAPEKWNLVGAIVLLIVSSSITMAVPFYIGKVIDIIYTADKDEMKNNINKISLVLLAVFVLGGLCNFGRIYLMSNSSYRITQNLRKRVYSSILKQETAMFDKVSTGELVGRLTGDAQLVSSAVTSNISDGLRFSIMGLTCVSMMFYLSPQLASVGLAIVPPVAAMAVLYGRFVRKISKDLQNKLAVLNTTTEEKISNIRTVKFFGQELNEIKKYDSKLKDLLALCYRESLYRGMFFGASGFSGNVIALSVLYYGGVMVSDDSITVGNLSAFLLYAAYIGVSTNGLSTFYSELNKAVGASVRLFELMDRQPKLPIEGGKILDNPLSGEIFFENVSFAYPVRKESPILNNFSLRIPSSKMTAIVGPSGSGKSTLALLLFRLYDPDSGSILLDDHDLRELDPMWVKSQISIVSQEPILFNGTVKENIAYGMEAVSEKEISYASKQANVIEFITKLPQGFDTIVGERGVTLSGGQRQRVAIARALIKNPKILVLDEATSALDAESEYFVQEALERVAQGRTVLIIAHRLSTIKNADMIAVLSKGKIVEMGTYNELVVKDGLFKRLVKHQTFG